MSETETIGWGTLIRQMVRHRCGPRRAAEHELSWRYKEAIGWNLPREERAAMLRKASEGAPVVFTRLASCCVYVGTDDCPHRKEWKP